MLNVTDNAQTNSHIAAHKCSDSGHLLVLLALHQLSLLGNDNSPSKYFLGDTVTKYLSRASLGLRDTLSVENGVKNS